MEEKCGNQKCDDAGGLGENAGGEYPFGAVGEFGEEHQVALGVEAQHVRAINAGVGEGGDGADIAGADLKFIAEARDQAQVAVVAGGEDAVVVGPARIFTGEIAEEGDLAVLVDDRVGEIAEFDALFRARGVQAAGGDELGVVGSAGVEGVSRVVRGAHVGAKGDIAALVEAQVEEKVEGCAGKPGRGSFGAGDELELI